MKKMSEVVSMTPRQLSMARAAIGASLEIVGNAVGVSKQAISYFEKGDTARISEETENKIHDWMTERNVYFGPGDSVSYGVNRYESDQRMIWALIQALGDAGIMPASDELLQRMKDLEP